MIRNKILLGIMCVCLVSLIGCGSSGRYSGSPKPEFVDDDTRKIERAFQNKRSGFQVSTRGIVRKVLPEDNTVPRHQRFILELTNGQTVLVAHNIDLAPRISNLTPGDPVLIKGEYEWNEEGGLIHWTHHDSTGKHARGWIIHDGKNYQ